MKRLLFILALTLAGCAGNQQVTPNPVATLEPCQVLLKDAPPGATYTTVPVIPIPNI